MTQQHGGTCISKVKQIDGVNYVIVNPGTNVQSLLKYVKSDASVSVKSANNGEVLGGEATLATNQLLVANGVNEKYVIVVKGDVNADGNIDWSDVLKLNKARLGQIDINQAEFLAGDVAENSEINVSDIIKLNKFRLGQISNL